VNIEIGELGNLKDFGEKLNGRVKALEAGTELRHSKVRVNKNGD
jgi:hypothetical protein